MFRGPKTMLFADGENLTMRYQAMVSDGGFQPRADVQHERDVFVWHPNITKWAIIDFIRAQYYSSAVGDEPKLALIKRRISKIWFEFDVTSDTEETKSKLQLVPVLFKKKAQGRKSRQVDIAITIDMMRSAFLPSVDMLYLLSGDGDYLPLISEVMRHGKQVLVAAFSSGLHSDIPSSVDEFLCLDDIFFTKNTKHKGTKK